MFTFQRGSCHELSVFMKDSKAIQLKLNELTAANEWSRHRMVESRA